MFAALARYEWALLEVVVLGLLFWQLFSLRRANRHAKDAEARAAAERDAGEGGG